jgi:hypothetical protein
MVYLLPAIVGGGKGEDLRLGLRSGSVAASASRNGSVSVASASRRVGRTRAALAREGWADEGSAVRVASEGGSGGRVGRD